MDCCFRLTLPVPLQIVTLCSLTGFLLSEFVSYRGIATKSQSLIIGSRLVDIAKISMIYLLHLVLRAVDGGSFFTVIVTFEGNAKNETKCELDLFQYIKSRNADVPLFSFFQAFLRCGQIP